jgi:hypothetical protein
VTTGEDGANRAPGGFGMFVLVLLACDDGTGTQPFAGTKMSDYFAFEGARTNEYNNSDTSIDYKLIVEKKTQTTQVEGREVVTMEYTNGNTAEVFGSVQWSSVTSDAVLVHGYSLGTTGALVTFDPPVKITDDDDAMRIGDTVVTETTDSDGSSFTYTSTLVEGVATCPSTANDDFAQCVHMTVDDGDGDSASGPLFTGDFIFVASWGAVFQTLPGWETEWELTDMEYTSSED